MFTRRLAPLFVIFGVAACGGRTSFDDEASADEAGADDPGTADGGANSALGSGGKSISGGAASGDPVSGGASVGAAGSGGRGVSMGGATGDDGSPSGGASAGSTASGGGSPQTCGAEQWTAEDGCRNWTTCEAGQYVLIPGTSESDRKCAACPENTTSSSDNEPACSYAGCDFSEVVVRPAQDGNPAECAPDPDYLDLGPSAAERVFGLAQKDNRVFVATTNGYAALVHEYEAGMLLETKTYPSQPYDEVSQFALSPDGRVYFYGANFTSALSFWLESHGADSQNSFRLSLGEQGSTGRGVRLLATDSDWILYSNGDVGGTDSDVTLAHSPHGLAQTPPEIETLPLTRVESIASDDQEQIWVVLWTSEKLSIGRLPHFGATIELAALPEGFVPLLITATPTGTAYAVGYVDDYNSQDSRVVELGPNGGLLRTWTLSREPETFLAPSAISVSRGRALFVSYDHWSMNGTEHPFLRNDTLTIKIDLETDSIATREMPGPNDERVLFHAVTSDGALYGAGESGDRQFLRRLF